VLFDFAYLENLLSYCFYDILIIFEDNKIQPFSSYYFLDRIRFLLRPAWTIIFLFYVPTVYRMTGMHHCTQLLVDTVSLKLLPGLACKYVLPDLGLPNT
jgi:hypothetical protein